MRIKSLFQFSLILLAVILLSGCQKDEDLESKAGTLLLKLSDAASDDEDIKGIFITINKVTLDDKPIRNFQPKTIEISSLKNGNTEILVSKELAAKEYNRITLTLSHSSGSSGDQGGSYVLTSDDTRYNLASGESAETEIVLSKEFEIEPGKTTKLVADFNLRKAIIRTESETNKYRFVTPTELRNSIRVVSEDSTGTIHGHVDIREITNSQIYVLIYRSGEFQASIEGTGSGPSKILFANSITSSIMAPDGSYYLPFLESGEYDIRLAQFIRFFDEEYTFYRFLPTTSRGTGVQLNKIALQSGEVKEIDIEVFRLF